MRNPSAPSVACNYLMQRRRYGAQASSPANLHERTSKPACCAALHSSASKQINGRPFGFPLHQVMAAANCIASAERIPYLSRHSSARSRTASTGNTSLHRHLNSFKYPNAFSFPSPEILFFFSNRVNAPWISIGAFHQTVISGNVRSN